MTVCNMRHQTRRGLARTIELSYYGVNELGKALAGTRTELDATLRPETRERVKAFGVRVNPRINLPPGRYHLRIGAREAVGGLTGSVFYDLEVPDFRKEKLMLGGLLVASAAGQQTPSIQAVRCSQRCCPLRRRADANSRAAISSRSTPRSTRYGSSATSGWSSDVGCVLLSENGRKGGDPASSRTVGAPETVGHVRLRNGPPKDFPPGVSCSRQGRLWQRRQPKPFAGDDDT